MHSLRWLRDVAITAAVVVAGFIALGTITGQAYSGLPRAAPQPEAPKLLAEVTSPHAGQPDCGACHRSHGAVGEALLAASHADGGVCVRCHISGGPADAVSTHSNIDTAWATESPFSVSCVACHDPHADPSGAGNRAMIRPDVNGASVVFTAGIGAGSYDDGFDDGQHNSLCVACHTTTSHNNALSTELIGEGHQPVGGDCLSCHPHGSNPGVRSGFMPVAPASPTPTATPSETPTPLPSATPTATHEPPPPPAPPLATDTPVPPPPDTPTPPPATDTPTPVFTPTETPTP